VSDPARILTSVDDLTDTQGAILTFKELCGPAWLMRKEAAVRDSFLLSGIRYHQHLNGLSDVPAALLASDIIQVRSRDVQVDVELDRTGQEDGQNMSNNLLFDCVTE
jgi:hypothetical protein